MANASAVTVGSQDAASRAQSGGPDGSSGSGGLSDASLSAGVAHLLSAPGAASAQGKDGASSQSGSSSSNDSQGSSGGQQGQAPTQQGFSGLLAANMPFTPLPTLPGAPGALPNAAGGNLPTVQAGPQMADQLVTVLSGLTAGPDGSHSVVLQLQPEGLGTVQASVTTTPNSVTVHLTAQSEAGFTALNRSLPQLQTLLSGGGGFGATVLLSRQDDPWSGQGGGSGSGGTGSFGEEAGAEAELAGVGAAGQATGSSSSDHTIDLHI